MIWRTLVAAAIMMTSAQAEAAKDPQLEHMTGQWVLTGTIAGQKTTHDVNAEWVLQDTYMRLTEVSREKDAAGKPQYEAEVLVGYDSAKKQYVCFWFDITGVASPNTGGTAVRNGDSLPFLFKIGGSDFHTTFNWLAKSGTWTWTMDGEEGGRLQPFARVTLTRK